MGKENWKDLPLVNNEGKSKKRFELKIDDHVAFVEYIISKQGIIYLTHTEVPKALAGMGVGGILASKVLAHIKGEGMKMAPLCPFVAAFIKRHPEEGAGLLAPGYTIK